MWRMFHLKTESCMSESFAEMFEASLKAGQSMQAGTIVNARVLDVKNDVVIVDAGLKSEGVIPLDEFKIDGEYTVAIGDMVEVASKPWKTGSAKPNSRKRRPSASRLGNAWPLPWSRRKPSSAPSPAR